MRKKNLCYLFLPLALGSCVAHKKAQRLDAETETLKKEQTTFLQKIEEVDTKRKEKLEKGELDDRTDSVARDYILRLKDSVNMRLARFNAISNVKKTRKKREEISAYLDQVKSAHKKEQENVLFFGDLFNAPTFSRLNTAAFFGPGEYRLSNDVSRQAAEIMQNILNDAIGFADKYSSRKLEAMFIVAGYADEQEITPGGSLYNDLANGVFPDDISRKLLNNKLSAKRASSIRNLMKTEYESILNKKRPANFFPLFIPVGKGEEYPKGTITDYKPIDERRRVALLYWSIIPELK